MPVLPAVRIEGGLLGPELFEQLVAADLPGQRPADFGVAGRRSLTDEMAAVFADARALWGVFQHRLERLAEEDPATTATRDAWVIPFFGLLGYELRFNPRAYEVDGLSFAISHRAGEASDAPPVHVVGARQELGRVPASGRPRLAPHSLVQEYLNRTEFVWGLVTNGLTLRLLRSSTFIRRQAYVEFDLHSILEDQRFQDFVALYRLLHRSRLPRGTGGDCLLEQYYTHSVEQGGRVREHLRDGVEKCIVQLANGFLAQPSQENDALRRRVMHDYKASDRIHPEEFYRQLLRLVYRLLFLLVSEDRGLLGPDRVYRESYGVNRLRRLADRLAAYNDYDDLWQSLRALWLVFASDELAASLKVPPLDGALFAAQDLDRGMISNRDLLTALWHLSWYREGSAPPRRVNYAALDVEEFGSVYESLLDFHPTIEVDGSGRLTFALIEGSERKSTGSYYTPPELVAELIKSALAPVIAERVAAAPPETKQEALLSIRVCDPACGSGHFLLAAGRRMGKELAKLQTGDAEPAPERVREATREVIGHCVYGVDKNPLAVDLCRVALWLESNTGARPLTFLDHRIRCGDSLIGVFDLSALADGIPNEAFKPLEEDDGAAAREFARRNRREREGERDLLAWRPRESLATLTRASEAIDQLPSDTPEAVRRKQKLFEQSHADSAWLRSKKACDLWTAAFFQRLETGAPAITSGPLLDYLDGRPVPAELAGLAASLAEQNRFFHWPLAFPEVFAHGGFDVVLGNPPFINAIEGAVTARSKTFLSSADRDLGGTADIAFHFVHLADRLARSDGRIGFVQPKTFLNSDSAQKLRARLSKERPPATIHIPHNANFFKGASSYVCVLVLGASQQCLVSDSDSFENVSWLQGTIRDDNWWRATQEILGHYVLPKGNDRITLSEVFEVVASMTAADAYTVKEFVYDGEMGRGPRLVTTGLIDPFVCKWGQEPCRYLGKSYSCPRISISLDMPPSLQRRLRNATRPKLLIAGLSNRLEAYLDSDGDSFGAVSTFSIFHRDNSLSALSQLCAWLNSDEATMLLRAQLGAASVGGGYMTVKKKVLQGLPIPRWVASNHPV